MRWSDRDMLGHVNNVIYLTYIEEARVLLIDELRKASEGLTHYLVAHVECDYLQSVVDYPATLDIDLWVAHVGMTSMTVDYELRRHDLVVARARNVMVATDAGSGRPRPLIEPERAVLEAHLH
jgi:acyl-CoA thioester hydrolase